MVLHACMHVAMDAAVRVYFRRIEVHGLDRFPADGAVLVVANHPAAWTDALILQVAFRRELHFVAHEGLFHPWIRGVFLRLFASLPVRHRDEGPLAVSLNRRTFDRCHTLLRRGAAIAVFPEGVSGSDRGLRPLKTGAARLVLEHVAAGDEAPALIPVAIHYQDRTGFRTRVDLVVGAPIPIVDQGVASGDPVAGRHVLTAGIGRALEAGLADAAAHASAATPVGVRAWTGLVSILGAVGLVLHAAPVGAIEWVAWHLAGLPQQVSFGRMLAALVILPLWYGGLVAMVGVLGGGAWIAIPVLAPFLGLVACHEFDRRNDRRGAERAAPGGESA